MLDITENKSEVNRGKNEYDPSCLFCKIVKGKEKAFKVFEDENTFAFLDKFPASKGHSIVVPKKHRKNIFELKDEEVSQVFKTVKKVSEGVKKAFSPKGINILQSNGKKAGQEIFHFHTHVVPRYEGDGIELEFNPEKISEGEKTGKAIKECIE